MKLGVYQNGPASLRLVESQAVPEDMRGGVLEIVGMETEPDARQQGHATALMQRMGAIADDHKTVLLLIPAPFDDKPLNTAKLKAWYSRLGFQQIQSKPCLMARPPKKHGR